MNSASDSTWKTQQIYIKHHETIRSARNGLFTLMSHVFYYKEMHLEFSENLDLVTFHWYSYGHAVLVLVSPREGLRVGILISVSTWKTARNIPKHLETSYGTHNIQC